MPPKKANTPLRVMIPFLVLGAAVGMVWVVASGPKDAADDDKQAAAQTGAQAHGQTQSQADAAAVPQAGDGAGSQGDRANGPSSAPAAAGDGAAPASVAVVDPAQLRVRRAPLAPYTPLGSAEQGDLLRLRFASEGAGIEQLTLLGVNTELNVPEPYVLQSRREYDRDGDPLTTGDTVSIAPMAARAVLLGDTVLDLYSSAGGVAWRETAPGAFEAIVQDAEGTAVLRLTRRFVLRPGSYELELEQRIENLSAVDLSVQFVQFGPIDLPAGDVGYGGDRRRYRFGRVSAATGVATAHGSLSSRQRLVSRADAGEPVWPTKDAVNRGDTLGWVALTNRYFAFAAHAKVDAAALERTGRLENPSFAGVQTVRPIRAGSFGARDATLALRLESGELALPAGSVRDLSIAAYAGPKTAPALSGELLFRALGIDRLRVYNFGGPCGFCTFQWLAKGLLGLLGLFQSYLVLDWALAIMLLVLCVRGILHPVTKRSQISMQRFGKQMQSMAPKQKRIQEKYAGDSKRIQQEMAKLWREEGVNPAGMLGCLPMFLQTPVWIALYAMLFYAYELRHEPAFFGLFQAMGSGFLSDLSEPDALIPFGKTLFSIPLLGPIESLNLLPLLLGVVFFVQQKYLTPPASSTMTPEQKTQQKIIKLMMVIGFPLFMYNAPSGLAIYFITNSGLGIFESRYIRAHIDQLDLTAPKRPAPSRAKRVQNSAGGSSKGFKDRGKKSR